jgi:thioredoxin reductase
MSAASSLEQYDAVIVGGGAAGLSAALTLGRARRRVLLASSGAPRNAPAHAAHNVFTRDGTPPADLLRIGRAQLAPYDVTVRDASATDASVGDDRISVTVDDRQVQARGLIIASGIRDVLPDRPGFRELWGNGVFHCPYCHGWEVAGQPLGVYGRGEAALHLVKLLRGWTSDLVLFTDGPTELEPEVEERIRSHGIVVREDSVDRLVGSDGLESVVMANGETVPCAGLFIKPKQELRTDLPHRLGCELTADGRVKADPLGRTSVARVFVAGDAGPAMQSVIAAAASGAAAGAGLNLDLLELDF